MKQHTYLNLCLLSVIMLTGCGNRDEPIAEIPTPTPTPIVSPTPIASVSPTPQLPPSPPPVKIKP